RLPRLRLPRSVVPMRHSPVATPRPVRSAEREPDTQSPDPAVLRRTVDAITTVSGCRRKEAREKIRSWLAGGAAIDDIEAYLRQSYRIDPVGVGVARRVKGGGHGIS